MSLDVVAPGMRSDLDALAGNRMDEAGIDGVLSRVGIGVLSLARDGEAYGVPVSFGYDGADRLYFVFVGYGETSRKESFAAATDRASFVAYEVGDEHDWRSVIVDGRLVEIGPDGWADASAALADNAWYPSLFRAAEPLRDLDVWALEIDSRSGLESDS